MFFPSDYLFDVGGLYLVSQAIQHVIFLMFFELEVI